METGLFMKNSIFTAVLEHGEDVGLNGTNYSLFHDDIEKKMKIDLTHPDNTHMVNPLNRLFEECFKFYGAGKNGQNYILKTEYYIRLTQQRELKESRDAAKSANRNAWLAISISIAAIIISAVLTWTQLNTPLSIKKSDLAALVSSSTPSGVEREVKLNSLQMKQILLSIEQMSTKNKKVSTIPSNEVEHHELINEYFENMEN